jgi:bifunctional non-homologous end joining protein LigD
VGKNPKRTPQADRLRPYRAKRSAQRTTEPFGARPAAAAEPAEGGPSRLFVVQKHAARNLHYDLRLELGGVLLSWAVPKGPAADPREKRLAVQVEDHPLDYADFEGLIPEGNYGAGAVIVFDRGRWVAIGDPEAGLVEGKLLFDLWGYKLRGRWTLFRTKGGPNQWLLVKKADAWADPETEPPQASIYSGLTVEELRDGADPAARVRRELGKRGAPRGGVDVLTVEPMLAEPRAEPFSRPGWLFEVKYDGYRLLAARRDGRAYLRYRRGQEVTDRFPEIATSVARLPYEGFVLDGELVVLDAEGRPSFQNLQQRVHLKREADVAAATVSLPAVYYVFDLLACEGHDLRSLPCVERKQILCGILPPAGPLRFSEHFTERGAELYEQVVRLGLEGIVAKRAEAPYRSMRSADWLKIRADRSGTFAVVGFTRPKGSRSGIGALHLAGRRDGRLVYAGRAGTGFGEALLRELRERLEPDRVPAPPCEGEAPGGSEHVWVAPKIVVEVRYKERTRGGTLRHPVFLRVREDLTVADAESLDPEAADPSEAATAPIETEREVHFTNLDKVFWPEEGYTKGDLIEYYRTVADWLLPWLADRPVVLTRYPDGIHGKSFYQKDAPAFAPEWIRTVTLWSEHAEREISYFVVEDVAGLVYLANLGTIPLHVWSSRTATLASPDWSILDLDPKGAPFADVVALARAIHEICSGIGLDCYVKTSGSTGLHVLVPLARSCTYEQSRSLAEVLARVVAAELPEIATLTRAVQDREGKVYIDYLQNGHGRLLVAPYSVRPLPGATVSTPLGWNEVTSSLAIDRFTIRTVPARLRRLRSDPWSGLLTSRVDLAGALSRLRGRVAGPGR